MTKTVGEMQRHAEGLCRDLRESASVLVGSTCALCEQTLQSVLRAHGVPDAQREAIVRDYRDGVRDALQTVQKEPGHE